MISPLLFSWLLRSCLSLAFAAMVVAVTAAGALARPCFVTVTIAPTNDPAIAAVRFASIVDGSGDVSLVADSATQRYTAVFRGLRFEAPKPARTTNDRDRFETPMQLVRLPANALRDDIVTLLETNSDKAASACTPQYDDLEYPEPRPSASPLPVPTVSAGARIIDPTVAAAPPVACAHPYVDASIDRAIQPAYPALARQQGLTGTAWVIVELDQSGHVVSTGLWRASGSNLLDASTLVAAGASSYAAPIFRCAPVGATFLYEADFTGATVMVLRRPFARRLPKRRVRIHAAIPMLSVAG